MVEQIQKKFPELKEVYAVQESWLAKLGHWDEALVKYNQKLVATPYDSAVLAGKMKCLDALGRWEEAIQVILLFTCFSVSLFIELFLAHSRPLFITLLSAFKGSF